MKNETVLNERINHDAEHILTNLDEIVHDFKKNARDLHAARQWFVHGLVVPAVLNSAVDGPVAEANGSVAVVGESLEMADELVTVVDEFPVAIDESIEEPPSEVPAAVISEPLVEKTKSVPVIRIPGIARPAGPAEESSGRLSVIQQRQSAIVRSFKQRRNAMIHSQIQKYEDMVVKESSNE